MVITVLVSDDARFAADLLERDYQLIAHFSEFEREYFFFHATDRLLADVKQLPYPARYALDSLKTYI